MKSPKCRTCGKEHALGGCPEFKSTAARKDVRREADNETASVPSGSTITAAGTQALPVDTPPKPKMGRPRTGYIKAEYNRQYSADKRAAEKLGVSVREYRASKA